MRVNGDRSTNKPSVSNSVAHKKIDKSVDKHKPNNASDSKSAARRQIGRSASRHRPNSVREPSARLNNVRARRISSGGARMPRRASRSVQIAGTAASVAVK